MARMGLETDGSDAAASSEKEAELKKELQRLVHAIVDEDDCSADTSDQALKTLYALRDLRGKQKQRTSFSFGVQNLSFPDEFRCPISKELMRDPVVVSTGLTYDRPFIQNWLKQNHRTCPQTQQVLSHSVLTPNYLVRDLISIWFKERGVEPPKPFETIDQEVITDADRGRFNSLLEKMCSSSLPDQKDAAKELRRLTKLQPLFRALFSESTDTIMQLLHPLKLGSANADLDLQEDVITTLLNLSIHEINKKPVAENPVAIALLIESLRSGNMETKRNAAAALFTLSVLDSNKKIIGRSGAIKPLLELLVGGHPLAMKDAASAIFNLCMVSKNKDEVIHEGAVSVILNMIMEGTLVDELLSILAMLSSHEAAIGQMSESGAIPVLFDIIRENPSDRSKENSISIIYAMCYKRPTTLNVIKKEEDANGTISILALNGTLRAQRKANSILESINRWNHSATPITFTS